MSQTDPEVWRAVPSVPGYLASSHGRVMKTPHIGRMPNGSARQYGGKPTHGTWRKDTRRYVLVVGTKNVNVARMVCEAFHGPQPHPYPQSVCMHLDENSRNNRPENLRWGSQKENLNAPGWLAYCRSRTGENNPFIKGRKAA